MLCAWPEWGAPAVLARLGQRRPPPLFLTVDVLHTFHKFFFDHPLKWVINIMGGEELDRRMVAIQPRVGERHW
jgi:hypothetical protein